MEGGGINRSSKRRKRVTKEDYMSDKPVNPPKYETGIQGYET
jgi:hypothetical protein